MSLFGRAHSNFLSIAPQTMRIAGRYLLAVGGIALLANTARAQIYITSDTTLNSGIGELVTVGQDADGNPFSNINVGIVSGANLTVGLDAYNTSTINVSGGLVDSIIANSSTVNLTGGSITSFLNGSNSSTISISGTGSVGNINLDATSGLTVTGGTIGYSSIAGSASISGGSFTDTFDTIEVNGFGAVTVSGGSFASGFRVFENGSLTITGSGLSQSNTGSSGFYDSDTTLNYIAKSYSLSGTLSSGDTINTTVYTAGSVAGNASSLTFSGTATATVAPDQYVTTDSTVSGIRNDVYIGTNQSGSTLTSPIVTVGATADTARVTALNTSNVTITGIVHDTVFAADSSSVTLDPGAQVGTVNSVTSSSVTVNGGSVDKALAFDSSVLQVNDGDIGYLATAGQAEATITGGTVGDVVAQEKSVISLSAGNVTTITTFDQAKVDISGGNIADIVAYGGDITISGGAISDSTLFNLQNSFGQAGLFELLGTDFVIGEEGIEGTYFDGTQEWSGIYWSLNGTLQNGDILNTRYFEAFGAGTGPNARFGDGFLLLSGVSAPEPGTFAFLLLGGAPVIGTILRRRAR